ncbi:bifunctional protein GlmU-like protein [Jimgerdemannia flammicorona]|uniref:Bifunctional protein GlmU-like protein n=1 Tax=Jimgerdemannia flammicorona TaxID=994334 RepID=A0A433D7A0_9FUNG|nr:bifunctional protein GlmU-like protein [Jimgerdemannia flammicorona]
MTINHNTKEEQTALCNKGGLAPFLPQLVLVLGAGYGTRLQKDILADSTKTHAQLLGVPKALLPLGNHDALITHWLALLTAQHLDVSQDLFVVANAAHHALFVAWAMRNGIPASHIANDGTTSNETRLGAVPDIAFGVRVFGLEKNNILVIGGDTLFLGDFSFAAFFAKFSVINAESPEGACLVTAYQVPDSTVHKVGVMELDQGKHNRVTGFVEKPRPEDTTSRSACPCFYLFHARSLPLLKQFLDECNTRGAGLAEYDATGKYLAYLYSRFAVYAMPISGRIDVGGLQSYVDAVKYFKDEAAKKGIDFP